MTDNAPLERADLRDIQGNLVGFNKDHQRLLFIDFPDAVTGRKFVEAMQHEVDSAEDVAKFNAEYSKRRREGKDLLSLRSDWVNIALSFQGLTALQATDVSVFPQEFQLGMRGRAPANGDVDASDPSQWEGPFAPNAAAVHALVIVGADEPALLDGRTEKVRAIMANAGVTEVGAQDGNVRPGDFAGHEHFGFKDGVSQPLVHGLTSGHNGGVPIAPGEFIIGHPDQDGNISGSAIPQPQPPATPGQPGYPAPPPIQSLPLPPWTKNGSFLVYRRLRQDVAGFHGFTEMTAPTAGLTQPQLEAKFVGRWPSGVPLERVPGGPEDTTTKDPFPPGQPVPDNVKINHFGYHEHDADGHLTPRAAHIRKAYPRDEQPPGAEEANRHRLLRRGIVYGPDFVPTEHPYPGSGPVPEDQDRGLLFLCYQSSIARGFEFVQQSWANTADFPQSGDGVDPIITQNRADPPFALPPDHHLTTQRWVTTTGGDYYFSPSISALGQLGTGPTQ